MRALVTGATGFVGPHLVALLDRPLILTRSAVRARDELAGQNVSFREFDLNSAPPPLAAMNGVEAVFHLAGESVAAGRWTKRRKQRIRDSRVFGTRHLVDALAQLPAGERPRVFVSASAVGYYGSRGEETLTEDSPPGDDFLAEVCSEWEREATRAAELGIRTAMLRIGIVLGRGGGALAKMLPPFRLGVGGRLGNGRQWMPWIHVQDLAALFLHVAKTETIQGPVNAVAPELVRNLDFTKALAKVLHRPAVFPAPYFGLRILFGEFAQVLFASQKVEPRVATATGFSYRYPRLEEALRAALEHK
ncbi:MAG: TIGR01777 family oxidoreductase [Pirellulales bacterium]